MDLKNKFLPFLIIAFLTFTACNKGPKVIESSSVNNSLEQNTGVFSNDSISKNSTNSNNSFTDDLHKVVVTELLPTTKYNYLNVKEGEEEFWIATRKNDVKVGKTYFYKGGLLKTNFESKEYNRTFEKVYLVSSLVETNHGNNSNVTSSELKNEPKQKEDIPTHTEKIIEHKGSIKIAELVKNAKKYEGKTVQLSGECFKINAGIMERNWIHLKDGSQDDYDLVITSKSFVPEGSVVTLKAIVTLNKDFGAGYIYDLILEDGIIVK